ncbi:MAG: DUF262 domain-containing protein [Proteobacteria bacterium]|nr:MAG: DUF262 domain-containing protein [Pseudomonadota bacterium]
MDDITLRQLISTIRDGQTRIPAFQRGFVWEPERVAFLMDSLYKSYPVGSLLLWRTRERLSFEKKLGPFDLPEPKADYPVDYILDGQQRATSIFGVFQTELTASGDDGWTHVYFDLHSAADVQGTQFVVLGNTDYDKERYFPLKTLFDTVAYRKATKDLSEEVAERIDKVQAVFKEARIPIQLIDTEDKATVAIVFERINQTGVPLDILQLLTAWTWSQDFLLQKQFEDLSGELRPFGFDEVGEDSNLLLRCCASVLTGKPLTESLIRVPGAEVRNRFEEVMSGVRGAIDFLRDNLKVQSLKNLPYSNLLIPLTVFFSSAPGKQIRMTHEQRETILRWFWRTCFAKRYNSQPYKNLETDVQEMAKLRQGLPNALGNFQFSKIDSAMFENEIFRINNVVSKTFVLMLAQKDPLSFISGQPISLREALKEYNRNEFNSKRKREH